MESMIAVLSSPPWPSPAADELNAQRLALLTDIFSRVDGAAIAIWAPRIVRSETYSMRLLAYNNPYKALCDTPSFGDGSPRAVSAPVKDIWYSSQETATEAVVSRERATRVIDAIHFDGLRQASGLFVHVSKVGRMRKIYAEMHGVFVGDVLTEVVTGETPLPDDTPVPTSADVPVSTSISQVRKGVVYPLDAVLESPGVEDAQSSKRISQQIPWQLSPLQQDAKRTRSKVVLEPPKRPMEPMRIFTSKDILTVRLPTADFYSSHHVGYPKAPPSNCKLASKTPRNGKRPRLLQAPFVCTQCMSTVTSQRRRGPDGTFSLCNRCGLRFRRRSQNERDKGSSPESRDESIDEDESWQTMSEFRLPVTPVLRASPATRT